MLENIKSPYLIKLIFSLLNPKTKLEIVKYNKALQKKLDISLLIYKNISDRCLMLEANGKGKEYNYDGELKFKGEYKNGKRNGYGEEYDYKGRISFKGEYKNGKRNGYGEELSSEGEIYFKGEYLENKRWNGKVYDYYSRFYEWTDNEFREKNFEGEYKNGKLWNGKGLINIKDGKGKVTIYDRQLWLNTDRGEIIFEGEYLNGEKNGKGKEYNDNGKLVFEGEYLKDKRWNGKGYDEYGNIIYELKNGKGYVKEYSEDGFIFEGKYLKGEKNGKGKEFYDNGNIKFEGDYLKGKKNGIGKEYYLTKKLLFEGEYLLGKKWNGKGYDLNGNIIYLLNNGNGKVKEFYNDNLIFEGEYLNGQRHGKGIEYNIYGHCIFKGEFSKGLRWSGEGYVLDNNIYCRLKNGKGYAIKYSFGFLDSNKILVEYEYSNGKIKKEDRRNLCERIEYENKSLNGRKNGKQYDKDGKLIFEGIYLYGERIKGKEYINEILEYEGEYLFGKKWNGKGYDLNGHIIYEINNGNGKSREYLNNILIFEGEYVDGIKLNGKEYYYKGNLIFKGKFKNKIKWNGKIKKYDSRGSLVFEGEIKEGKKYNVKKYDTEGNLIFEGEMKEGEKWNGKEYDYKGNLIFKGEYFKGKRWNGKGKEYDSEGILIFEGEIKEGEKWNGKGKEYTSIFLGRGNEIILDLENLKDKVKWKEYYNENKVEIILFEGKYYEGKKWTGQFNEYDSNKIFKGKIYKGKKWNGKEIEYKKELLFRSDINEHKATSDTISKSYFNYEVIYEADIIKGKIFIIKDNRIK